MTFTALADCPSVFETVNMARGNWWIVECGRMWERRMVEDVQCNGGTTVILKQRYNRRVRDKFNHVHTNVDSIRMFPRTTFINIAPDKAAHPRDYFTAATNNLAPLSIRAIAHQPNFARQLAVLALASETCDLGLLVPFEPGVGVRITAGPLMGLEGVIKKVKPGFVYLPLFEMGAMTEVASTDVEPI